MFAIALIIPSLFIAVPLDRGTAIVLIFCSVVLLATEVKQVYSGSEDILYIIY